MPSIIQFQALSGVHEFTPYAFLLEIDGFSILLDCGWDEQFNLQYIDELSKYVLLASIDWLIDYLLDCLVYNIARCLDWLIDPLIDWFINRLIYWLATLFLILVFVWFSFQGCVSNRLRAPDQSWHLPFRSTALRRRPARPGLPDLCDASCGQVGPDVHVRSPSGMERSTVIFSDFCSCRKKCQHKKIRSVVLFQSRHDYEDFEIFTLDHIDAAFERIKPVKYNQTISLKGRRCFFRPFHFSASSSGGVFVCRKGWGYKTDGIMRGPCAGRMSVEDRQGRRGNCLRRGFCSQKGTVRSIYSAIFFFDQTWSPLLQVFIF